MAYSQISMGSAGEDVKKLQTLLNEKGYSLDVDGIFGAKTQAAVKDYQSKNALQVDGIAGKNTWSSLVAAPAAETPKPTYEVSDEAAALSQQLAALQDKKPADYAFSQQGQWQEIIDKILNREDFSYDLNADALYQHYKDQYAAQGKLAMLDTMGQAATKTGGYGNSYAQTAGQQAYQSHLQKINDIIPELYAQAYDRYDREGDALEQRYDMLADQNAREYGQYRDSLSDYYAALEQLTDSYRYQREQDYQAYRDALEDSRYEAEQAEDKRQFELEYALQQAASQKKSSTAAKEGLSVSEYNAIHDKCLAYAQQGQDQLAAYLEGLVAQGSISSDLAWQILQSFFPLYEEKQEIYDV